MIDSGRPEPELVELLADRNPLRRRVAANNDG